MEDTFSETTGQIDRPILNQELDDIGVSSERKEHIFQIFWRADPYNSIISYRPYFDLLKAFLHDDPNKEFDRFDFYSFIFTQFIESSFDKKDHKNALNILFQIGLYFEQLQTVEIEIQKLDQFLRDINSPKDWFKPDWFVENKLGKIENRDGKNTLILTHHTLSEALATAFIFEQSDVIRVLEKFIIFQEDNFEALIPSWFGVLRFIFECNKREMILSWALDWIEKHPEDINESLSDILCNLQSSVSGKFRKRIYDVVYKTYFDRAVWIPVWTRTGLGKYVDRTRYDQLKQDLETGENDTERMVHTGNIVAIVHSMIDAKSKLLTSSEKDYWKSLFLEYAQRDSSENGVLQRHSLHALASFHDESIIPQVARNFDSSDSLVRDAFMDFCTETDPNSQKTIDYLIKGISENKTIYARLGIDKISDKRALQYFLGKIADNKKFLKEYTKYRSIFEKDPEEPHLIKHLQNVFDVDTAVFIQKVIFAILSHDEIYQMGQSGLLKELILLQHSFDDNILFEILDFAETLSDTRQNRVFWENRLTFSELITSENWKEYVERVQRIDANQKFGPIYDLYKTSKHDIYRQAVKSKAIKPLSRHSSYEKEQMNREKKIYQEFYEQLNRGEDRYDPNAFEYFLKNKETIKRFWKEQDKERLIQLAVEEGIQRINPREFRVEILGDRKTNQEFSWSAPAAYFGYILEVIQEYRPKMIKQYLQKIVDYVPYSFSHDIFPILESSLPTHEGIDFSFLNGIMFDQSQDTRYLIPATYIYFVADMAGRDFVIDGAKDVLYSFVLDERISGHDRRSALEKLEQFISPDDEVIEHQLHAFAQAVELQDDDSRQLAYIANALLITVYKDEEAIDWRFKKIEEPIKFVRQEGVHTPSSGELEIDYMSFAKPLIELKDIRYLHRFLGLLQKSVDLAEDAHQNNLWDYVQYLWRIVFSYAESLVEQHSINPYLAIQAFVESMIQRRNANWLKSQVNQLRIFYITGVTKNVSSTEKRGIPFMPLFEELEEIQTNIEKPLSRKEGQESSRQRAKIIPKKKQYKLFISHATKGKGSNKHDFEISTKIYELFNNLFPDRIYFDDKKKPDIHETHTALSSSEYGLSICTDRYISRYNAQSPDETDSVIVTEVEYFDTLIRINSESVIAVTLDVTREYANSSISPFTNRIYIFEAPYEDNSISTINLAEIIFAEIKKKIK